jgi:hypothetical protein
MDQRLVAQLVALLVCLSLADGARAQDIEPRRWTPLPVDSNVLGLGYAYTDGNLFFDPVLEIQDAKVSSQTLALSYVRSFDCFGKTGRVDAILPYQWARWDGLLAGAPATREREGFSDPWLRFSLDLTGAPALKGKEYADYRGAHPDQTVVGVALGVLLPLGDYHSDKLLNLGQNRFAIRPQAGVVRTQGPWSFELTSSIWFFTDNEDFFGGNKLAQDPLFDTQVHVVRVFPNKCWASAGAAYAWGGESSLNGQSKGDERSNLLSSVSFGMPLGESQGLKVGYIRGDTQNDVGADTNTFFMAWSFRF